MKRLLITGANGFIGSHLIEEALAQGYEVFAGIRKQSNRRYLTNPGIKFIELDYGNKKQLREQLLSYMDKYGPFNYIIHNAGVTKTLRKEDFDTVNYHYTKNFVEAIQSIGLAIHKFVFISSLAAFGPGNKKTLVPVRETDIPRPVSVYGRSKLKAETFIRSIPDFPYLIFRPTGVYGPREEDYYVMYKMINKHIETYIATSKQHLTFIYVKDLARLIIDGLKSTIIRQSYFATDGKQYTTKEFSDIVKAELNKKTIKIVFPKFLVKPIAFISEKISCLTGKIATLNTEKYNEISQKNWLCDSRKTFEDFDFLPEYDLEKGIKETISWYKEKGRL